MNFLKYIRTSERGVTKPKPMKSINLPVVDWRKTTTSFEVHDPCKTSVQEDTWRINNPFKWTPNNHVPMVLREETPLLDNSNTPRGAKRKITLERSFDRFAFMYTRNSPDSFDPKD